MTLGAERGGGEARGRTRTRPVDWRPTALLLWYAEANEEYKYWPDLRLGGYQYLPAATSSSRSDASGQRATRGRAGISEAGQHTRLTQAMRR